MKKIFYFVAALVMSCAAVSCNKEASTTETVEVDSLEVVTDSVEVTGDSVTELCDTVSDVSEVF